ncbi:MAG: hypothetical protein KAT32_04195 [Candidatus Moranbacteria bacterium]|nr:hypothetical protein [Candidatus Moranbacteria bacterium]
MKIFFFALIMALFSSVLFFNSSFQKNVNANIDVANKPKPSLYLSGTNQYQRNGLISFSSQEAPVINVQGRNLEESEISIDVYEANMQEVLEFLTYDNENKQINHSVSLKDRKKVATFQTKWEDNFEVPYESSIGVRLIYAHVGELEIYSFVIRSNVGAIVKEGNNEILIWTQNFDTKRKASNQNIIFYNLKQSVSIQKDAVTNSEGIATVPISSQYDVAIVGEGDDLAFVPVSMRQLGYGGNYSFAGNFLVNKYFVFTDRTLYKPEDTLYFKAVLRDDNDINFLIPSGSWRAKVVNGWGDDQEVISEKVFTANSYGTFDGEFQLPEDAKIGGEYRLIIEKVGTEKEEDGYWWNSNSSEVYFQVEHYRKPEYTLEMEVEKNELINKSQVNFNIEGKYFSGQSLSEMEVKYSIKERDAYNYTFYSANQTNYFNYGYHGNEIKSGTAILDGGGLAQASFDTDVKGKGGKNKIYSIELNYASTTGENVVAQKNILVFAGEYNIYRENYKYGFHVGEEIELDLILKENKESSDSINLDSNSNSDFELGNKKLKILPKRTWWEKELVDTRRDKSHYDYKRKEEILDGFEIATDSQGKVKLRFSPQTSGRHEFKIIGVDSRGNEIIKDFSVWVSDKNYSYNGRGSQGISLTVDKENYELSENVSVEISSEIPDRDILFSVQRNFIHEYQIVSLNGNSAKVDFEVLDEHMPEANVEVATFSNDKIDRDSTDFKVSAETQRLNISIETDKDFYNAGEEVKAKIKVTDQNGKSQKADVTLWTIDKALFELTGASNQNIFKAFWSYRYGGTNFSHSLKGLSINATEKGGCFKAGSQVLMSDNSTKNIEEIKVGDYILTREGEDNEKLVKAKVIKEHKVEVDGYFIINNNLKVTGNHIVWTKNNWKRVDQIQIGDILINQENKEILIKAMEWRKEKTMVYNLEIENKHSYFVNEMWVHNGKGGGVGRSIFKDTAYWNPKIVTDKNGEAEVSFKLPDDLTTWVFSALGVTEDTKVGDAKHEIIVSQPVILRPHLPNIFYTKDEVVVTVEAQNFSGKKRNFQATIEFDGGEVKNNLQEIEIESGETKEITFAIYPKEEKDTQLTFSLESMDEDLMGDRVTKKVSIEKFGFLEKSSSTHKINEEINLKINEDAFNDQTKINVEVSATLLGSLPSAVEYLLDYPYGCVEQTTSRFMAALKVKQNPEIFYKANQENDVDLILDEGVKRLIELQNSDGGWGWWSGESGSSPFISIYVAESLLEAREVGVEIDEKIIYKIRDYFQNYNYNQARRPESDMAKLERKIVVTYGQALFKQKNNIIEISPALDPDMIALGVMTNIRNGYTDSETNGVRILKTLLQEEGGHRFWQKGSYNRFGSQNGSTALGLRAFLMADVEKEEIDDIVKYLVDSRKKRYWSSTFATSKVVQALTEYSEKYESDLNVNKKVQVYLNDEKIATETLNFKNPFINLPISVENIKKENSNLKVQSDDDVYITLIKKEFRTDRNAQAMNNNISIEKIYKNKNQTGKIGRGDIVDVEIKVSGLSEESAYLVVEDKLPAGLIPVNQNLKNAVSESKENNYDYAQREYTENGIIFHREYINAETLTFSYKAKAIGSGIFIDPPAVAEMMYNPEVYARTNVQNLEISSGSQQEDLTQKSTVSTESKFEKFFKNGRDIIIILFSLTIIAYGVFMLVRDKFKI